MKILKYLVAFGAVASLTTGCIKEEFPTNYVSNEQMAESPAALVNGMNAWLTTYDTMGAGEHYDFGWPGICMGTDALTPRRCRNGLWLRQWIPLLARCD